jgi:hypothetical protein
MSRRQKANHWLSGTLWSNTLPDLPQSYRDAAGRCGLATGSHSQRCSNEGRPCRLH